MWSHNGGCPKLCSENDSLGMEAEVQPSPLNAEPATDVGNSRTCNPDLARKNSGDWKMHNNDSSHRRNKCHYIIPTY